MDPSTVTTDSFYLIANSERVAGTVSVSSTRMFATFFPTNPMPASTEVRVVVEGDTVLGVDGLALDGDGNDIAGGQAVGSFRTLPLTRVPGTNIFGYIYDSYNTNADGSNIPIVGATIRVDASTARPTLRGDGPRVTALSAIS